MDSVYIYSSLAFLSKLTLMRVTVVTPHIFEWTNHTIRCASILQMSEEEYDEDVGVVDESEDISELKNVVVQTLQSNGVLGVIRAQLRAAVFTAIDEQERSQGVYHPNQHASSIRESENGVLLTELIRDFLEYYDLDHTLSVFQSEVNMPEQRQSKVELAGQLGLNPSPSKPGPLLGDLILSNRTLQTSPGAGSTKTHYTEDEVGGSRPEMERNDDDRVEDGSQEDALERDPIFSKFGKKSTIGRDNSSTEPGQASELGPPHTAISEGKNDSDDDEHDRDHFSERMSDVDHARSSQDAPGPSARPPTNLEASAEAEELSDDIDFEEEELEESLADSTEQDAHPPSPRDGGNHNGGNNDQNNNSEDEWGETKDRNERKAGEDDDDDVDVGGDASPETQDSAEEEEEEPGAAEDDSGGPSSLGPPPPLAPLGRLQLGGGGGGGSRAGGLPRLNPVSLGGRPGSSLGSSLPDPFGRSTEPGGGGGVEAEDGRSSPGSLNNDAKQEREEGGGSEGEQDGYDRESAASKSGDEGQSGGSTPQAQDSKGKEGTDEDGDDYGDDDFLSEDEEDGKEAEEAEIEISDEDLSIGDEGSGSASFEESTGLGGGTSQSQRMNESGDISVEGSRALDDYDFVEAVQGPGGSLPRW